MNSEEKRRRRRKAALLRQPRRHPGTAQQREQREQRLLSHFLAFGNFPSPTFNNASIFAFTKLLEQLNEQDILFLLRLYKICTLHLEDAVLRMSH